MITIAAMITVMTTLTSISERNVNAQMLGDYGVGWAGNAISSQQQQHEQRMINNDTINLEGNCY
jgi:hypothetical protein